MKPDGSHLIWPQAHLAGGVTWSDVSLWWYRKLAVFRKDDDSNFGRFQNPIVHRKISFQSNSRKSPFYAGQYASVEHICIVCKTNRNPRLNVIKWGMDWYKRILPICWIAICQKNKGIRGKKAFQIRNAVINLIKV